MSTKAERKRRQLKQAGFENEAIVWHYTYDEAAAAIWDSKLLLPPCKITTAKKMALREDELASLRKVRGFAADEKLLLFSERQDWEPASYRAIHIPSTGAVQPLRHLDDYDAMGWNVYRIGVSTRHLEPWVALKRRVRMANDMAASLESLARRIGSNPHEWWGTTNSIVADKWVAFEIYNAKTKTWEHAISQEKPIEQTCQA